MQDIEARKEAAVQTGIELREERLPGAFNDLIGRPEATSELLQRLHQRGMQYTEIADFLGVTYQTIFRWVRGLSRPSTVQLINEALYRLYEDYQRPN